MSSLWDTYLQELEVLCGDLPVQVRKAKPLVHLLTNYVTVTDCVNAVLAVGGRAICSHAPQEAAEVCAGADALVLNLGGTEYYNAMELAAQRAFELGIPCVMDPVGCAASSYRRSQCMHMINAYGPRAIRGNYAEISAILDSHAKSSGLDSTVTLDLHDRKVLLHQMMTFAAEHQLILIASGPVDLLTDGDRCVEISRGTKAQRRITGAGCMSSAVLAAFFAVEPSLDGAAAAMYHVALAGEAAQAACRETGTGAGHFHMYFLDALSAGEGI